MKKIRSAVLVAGLTALTVVGGLAGPASAASSKYDGKDPNSFGCAATAKTVASKAVLTGMGDHLGTIELRYSTACRTVWAKITADKPVSDFGNGAEASIIRKDGSTLSKKCSSGTSCYTPMLDDKSTSSYAKGDITIFFARGIASTKSY